MTAAGTQARELTAGRGGLLPPIVTGLAFVVLFLDPAILLLRDWWTNPEAGHGLLLAPVAGWLAWKKGWVGESRPSVALGLLILVGAVLLRTVSAVGLVVYYRGVRQALAWWLPFVLLALAIPLPELVTSTIALPLQFRASRMGAALLEWRQVPVRLTGNVIEIPGNRLFVTEACSGLRSLTALLSIGFLMGGLWLNRFWSRTLLIALAIPIAVVINGVRVFLTGFLVYFVDPKMGEGFMHMTEGWLLFLVSLVLIGMAAAVLAFVEKRISVARAT
jgi:exosortase